ncbi:MAG TPA: hypothetical protein VKA58_11890 [Propionibacteriaceae bacterium]|nr:hypothetical protein [Propionibacteriaceae bacterium]
MAPARLPELSPSGWISTNQRVHESGATPGHAFVQNLRRGHYELAAEEAITRRLPVAFDELALAI